ncbi:addiction module protein [Pelagicoccus albus]|uniref:Addiction module protein n=1 Tax=Pelagicoccus albus TaxID=415222 RepID=A0A7X1B4Z3_9BACT|nr:addiction module protein [Pelagicoccus albus]MBC2605738.1 addiction module protein [Pelagicoccus albus]
MLAENLRKLSKSEKILLINDLWDEIADTEDDFPLSLDTKELLDRRYEAFQANPEEGLPWDEVKKRIQSEL